MIYHLGICLLGVLAVSHTVLPHGTPERPTKTTCPGTPESKKRGPSSAPSSPGAKRRSPARKDAAVYGSPKRHIHTSPLTPYRTKTVTAVVRETLSFQHQADIPAYILAELDNAATEAVRIDGRLHQHGILFAEKRATYYFPYNLRNRVVAYRDPASGGIETCLGGNGSPMNFKTPGIKGNVKNQFKHVVPLRTVLEVIKLGNTFIRHDETGRLLLVFIASATMLSNNAEINELLSSWDEIQIAFGYTPDCTDTTNPFFLFHAMGDKSTKRDPALIPVIGVKAYLDESSSAGRGPILRFDLSTIKEVA